MFDFCIENHGHDFGSLTQNCLQLDKSAVSTFLIFLLYKYGVIFTQNNNYVECFNFIQQMFVFAHLFPDILIRSTKLHFQSWRKNSPTISLFFGKMTIKVSRNSREQSDVKIEHLSDIFQTPQT